MFCFLDNVNNAKKYAWAGLVEQRWSSTKITNIFRLKGTSYLCYRITTRPISRKDCLIGTNVLVAFSVTKNRQMSVKCAEK